MIAQKFFSANEINVLDGEILSRKTGLLSSVSPSDMSCKKRYETELLIVLFCSKIASRYFERKEQAWNIFHSNSLFLYMSI